MKAKLWVLLVTFLFGVQVLQAQTIEVSGTVSDDLGSLPGATLLVKGTTHGTITDFDGNFSFKVFDLTDTLIVSFVGYSDLIYPINGNTVLDIQLNVQSNQLEEIIVVGYGTQKKKEVTGATDRISSEEITATPTLRIEQALQGRTPGVQVTSLSGQPGEEPTVRIRGTGTTGNAKPLYIVDGMAVGGIDYLNPGDIESMDILKDASSAAIYGARAANGVVLITTKSGKKGKFQVTYDAYYGIQNTVNRLDMLGAEDYKMIMNEGARNSGLTEPFDLNEISPHDTDWQDALFGSNVPMQNHQLSFTGGNEKSTFASSLSYFTQEGIIGGAKSAFDRYTARINSRHKVNSVISFGNTLAYTNISIRGIGSNTSFNGAYSSALNIDPLTPVFETDPDKLSQNPYASEPVVTSGDKVYGISEYVGAEVVNPLALLEISHTKTRKDELVGNIYGELEPIKGLKFRSTIGIDLAYLINDGFRPLFYLNGAQLNDDKTTVNKEIARFDTWQWENTISYEKEMGEHRFSVLGGTTAFEFNYENLTGFNADVPGTNPEQVYLNQAIDTVWTANGGASHSALFSYFGRVNYNFMDKYSVSAVMRRDGSSKFGANSRYGVFPSIGLAWVTSSEPFMEDMDFVDYLKVRASWGVNGNQEIGDYQFVSIINQGRGYTFGNGRAVGSSPLFVENADIRWEESEQYNFGIDLGVLNNRLQFTTDFYIKKTEGLLERIPIPAHVGNDGPVANVGSVQNSGVELSVNWQNVSGDWDYNFGVNGAYNKNEMTFIGNDQKVLTGASWAIAGAVTRSEEGLPISYFWGYKTDGIFQNEGEVFSHINNDGDVLQPKAVAGDVRFVDVNGDGEINEDDRTNLGNPIPDFTFGMNASVGYKDFDFSMFLQGALGNEIFNGTQRQDLRYTNRTTAILDRWTGEGTSNEVPRYAWIDVNNNARVSDLYIEDGSYMRVKNIQLGYNLPESMLQRVKAANWRFYISVENVLTFTKYTGVDPEIGALSSFDIGIDRAVYPQARTMRFGTSVTF